MKNNTGILSLTLSAWTVLAGALLIAIPNQALAYIDPGAGSMLVQLILGGTAGLLLVGRLFWVGLKSRVMKLFSKHRERYSLTARASSGARPFLLTGRAKLALNDVAVARLEPQPTLARAA
jgi:hypothetical protein